MYSRPQLYLCFKTRFKERCKFNTVKLRRLLQAALSWRELLHYWQADCRKGQVLDGKGQRQRDSQRPTEGFPLTEKSFNKITKSSGNQQYPVCEFHALHTPPARAGSQSQHTEMIQHAREKVLRDEAMNEEGRRQIHRHRRQGRTLGSTTYQGYRQETKMEWLVHGEEQEMTFVRKVAFLTEKLLPLRYFKWRGSKDLRVGVYPFLKVP